MRVHSIAMPAASKKSPERRRKRKRHGGSWIYHRNCKRSVIRERVKKPRQEEEREREKRRNCVIIFVIYLGKRFWNRILMRRVLVL